MTSKKLFRSKLFWIGILCFFLLWGYSISSFLKISDENYVGPLVSINSGSLIIDDGKEGEKEIFYDMQTQIFPRKFKIQNLPIGTAVFIEVSSRKEIPLHAKFIRVLPARR